MAQPTQHPHYLWSDLFRSAQTEMETLRQALSQNILFRALNRSELNTLLALLYERVYQPDEYIFRQNDRGFGMYFIIKGRVAIRTHTPDAEVNVTTLGAGTFFGELSLVDPVNIRTASAVAVERASLVGFFKPDLMEIIERRPAMGAKILFQLSLVLGRRLSETTEKITQLKRLVRTQELKPHSEGR